jgi:hypothetical protein
MSQYINRLGTVLSEALERAASAQPGQFCGYWANINFWFSELEHFVVITNGYEERLRLMRKAYDRQIEKADEHYNLDEFGEPFNGVKATTSRGDRKRLVSRAVSAFRRLTDRALEMKLIGQDQHDDFAQRLTFSEPIKSPDEEHTRDK